MGRHKTRVVIQLNQLPEGTQRKLAAARTLEPSKTIEEVVADALLLWAQAQLGRDDLEDVIEKLGLLE